MMDFKQLKRIAGALEKNKLMDFFERLVIDKDGAIGIYLAQSPTSNDDERYILSIDENDNCTMHYNNYRFRVLPCLKDNSSNINNILKDVHDEILEESLKSIWGDISQRVKRSKNQLNLKNNAQI